MVGLDPPVTVTRWPCTGGRQVAQAVIEGGGHSWPGSRPVGPLGTVLGFEQPSPALDATEFLVSNLRVGRIGDD